MAVDVRRPHHRSQTDARRLVEAMAEDLAARLKLTRQWDAHPGAADRLVFQGTGVNGFIDVDEAEVHVHVERRFFLPVSERWIRARVEERMDEHLAPPPSRDASASRARAAPDAAPAGEEAEEDEAEDEEGADSAPANLDAAPKHQTHAEAAPPPLVGLAASAFRIAAGSGRIPGAALKALLFSAGDRASLGPERRQDMQEMGAHLRALREQAGLSVQELADQIGVGDPSFLRAVEAGRAALSRDLIARLASVLAARPAALAKRLARAYRVR